MANAPLRLDDVLYVGQRVFFYPDPHRKGARSIDGVIRGWQRDGYLLLELLEGRDQPVVFRQGSACSTRFLKEGMACAIDSIVLDSQVISKRPAVRIAWTDRLRAASLRRAERIEVNLPCTLNGPEGDFAGRVCDMSTGGVGVRVDRAVQAGARLSLSCRLPDGVELQGLPVMVRNLRRELDGGALLGCSFADEHERDAQAAGFYVTSTLMRQRGAYEEGVTALIMDDDALATAIVQKRLVDGGCACEVYGNLLDGVFRARLRAPMVILVRFQWGDLSALEVCRLLRQGHALQSTAIFAYGEGAEEHALALRRAGATGVLASIENPAEVFTLIQSKAPERAAG